jgi:hypothetical protein
VDGTNGPPIDYDSTYGPQEVTIAAGQTAVTLPTNTGQPDGAIDPVTVSLVDPFLCQVDSSDGVGSTATAGVQNPQLTLWLTDADYTTPVNVTNLRDNPAAVPVGEMVTLTAKVNGKDFNVDWTLPGNNQAIENYTPTTPSQLFQVAATNPSTGMQVVSGASAVNFEWVAAGPSPTTVTATDPGTSTSATASFNVQAPDVTATATLDPTVATKRGGTLLDDRTFTHGIKPGLSAVNMVPLMWNITVPVGGSGGGFEYAYAQTMNAAKLVCVPPGNAVGVAPGVYVPSVPLTGLDSGFPYLGKSFTLLNQPPVGSIGDSPGAEIYQGFPTGFTAFRISVTTYLMCEEAGCSPVSAGWVPLASITWSYTVVACWVPGVNNPWLLYSSVIVSGGAAADNIPNPFTQTSQFPTWSRTVAPPLGLKKIL